MAGHLHDADEAWDTRGYIDLESVLQGNFEAPQAVPEWLLGSGIEWDVRTGHRKRPGRLPDATTAASEPAPRTPSSSSTAPPPKWQHQPHFKWNQSLRSTAGSTPQAKSSRSRAVDETPSTAASTLWRSPEKMTPAPPSLRRVRLGLEGLLRSDCTSDAATPAPDEQLQSSIAAGPPGMRGQPGVTISSSMKPGEYEPARKPELETEPGSRKYMQAVMHGERFDIQPVIGDPKQMAAYRILKVCDNVTTLITKATEENVDPIHDKNLIPPPWAPHLISMQADDISRRQEVFDNAMLLRYSEEERAAKIKTASVLKTCLRHYQKTRAKQESELKRVEQRLVMQARHANTLTSLATGGHEEEYSARLFKQQLKHSQYAAMAALGTCQICRFKTFSAFQKKLQDKKKGRRRRKALMELSEMKASEDTSSEGNSEDLENEVKAKGQEYRSLRLELEQVRERQRDVKSRSKKDSLSKAVGQSGQDDMVHAMTEQEKNKQRAAQLMNDEKAAINFKRLINFIDSGQANLHKLNQSVNRLDKKEKLVMEQLTEQVEDECDAQVEEMLKIGVVPKELMQKIRQTESIPLIGAAEVRAMQRRRDRLKAIQESIQDEIEKTALKKATDAAANKAYAEALRENKDAEKAKELAEAEAARMAQEQMLSTSMLCCLKPPSKDGADAVAKAQEEAARAREQAEAGKAKVEAQKAYALQKQRELAALQGDMASMVSGAAAMSSSSAGKFFDAQDKMAKTFSEMEESVGEKGAAKTPPASVNTGSVRRPVSKPSGLNEAPEEGRTTPVEERMARLEKQIKQAQAMAGDIASRMQATGGQADVVVQELLDTVASLSDAMSNIVIADDENPTTDAEGKKQKGAMAYSAEALNALTRNIDKASSNITSVSVFNEFQEAPNSAREDTPEEERLRREEARVQAEAEEAEEAEAEEAQRRQAEEEVTKQVARRQMQADLEAQTQQIYEETTAQEAKKLAHLMKLEELQSQIAGLEAAWEAAEKAQAQALQAKKNISKSRAEQKTAEVEARAEAEVAAKAEARSAARKATLLKEADQLATLKVQLEQETKEKAWLEDTVQSLKDAIAKHEMHQKMQEQMDAEFREMMNADASSSATSEGVCAGSAENHLQVSTAAEAENPPSSRPSSGKSEKPSSPAQAPASSSAAEEEAPLSGGKQTLFNVKRRSVGASSAIKALEEAAEKHAAQGGQASAGTAGSGLEATAANDDSGQAAAANDDANASSSAGSQGVVTEDAPAPGSEADAPAADSSSATTEGEEAAIDSAAQPPPVREGSLKDLFIASVRKVIEQNRQQEPDNSSATDASDDVCGDAPEDILKDREQLLKESYGVELKALKKDDKRTGFRLHMQKTVKQKRHQLQIRTKVLLSLLSPEQAEVLHKAGVVQVPGKKEDDKKNKEVSTYEQEEGRLKNRLQMLVNLIDFWSRRLEQANLLRDVHENNRESVDHGDMLAAGVHDQLQGHSHDHLPEGRGESLIHTFGGGEEGYQRAAMMKSCQEMLQEAEMRGDEQEAQQIQQMISHVAMGGPLNHQQTMPGSMNSGQSGVGEGAQGQMGQMGQMYMANQYGMMAWSPQHPPGMTGPAQGMPAMGNPASMIPRMSMLGAMPGMALPPMGMPGMGIQSGMPGTRMTGMNMPQGMGFHGQRGSFKGMWPGGQASQGADNSMDMFTDAHGNAFTKADYNRVYHGHAALRAGGNTALGAQPIDIKGQDITTPGSKYNRGFYDPNFDPRLQTTPKFDPRVQSGGTVNNFLINGPGAGAGRGNIRDARLFQNSSPQRKLIATRRPDSSNRMPSDDGMFGRFDHSRTTPAQSHKARFYYKRNKMNDMNSSKGMDMGIMEGMWGASAQRSGPHGHQLSGMPPIGKMPKSPMGMMSGGLAISGANVNGTSGTAAFAHMHHFHGHMDEVAQRFAGQAGQHFSPDMLSVGNSHMNHPMSSQAVRSSLKRMSINAGFNSMSMSGGMSQARGSQMQADGGLNAFGGPSVEQHNLNDKFVRDLLHTAHLPMARDALLSQLCIRLEEPERQAIRLHMFRIFAQPEPVQRLALKSLSRGKIGHMSPLRRCKCKNKAAAQKLLSVATVIGRRLISLFEQLRDAHHHEGGAHHVHHSFTNKRGSIGPVDRSGSILASSAHAAEEVMAGKASLKGNDIGLGHHSGAHRRSSLRALDPVMHNEKGVEDLMDISSKRLSMPRSSLIGEFKSASNFASGHSDDGTSGAVRNKDAVLARMNSGLSWDMKLKLATEDAQKRLVAASQHKRGSVDSSDTSEKTPATDDGPSKGKVTDFIHKGRVGAFDFNQRQAQSLTRLFFNDETSEFLDRARFEAGGEDSKLTREEKIQMVHAKYTELMHKFTSSGDHFRSDAKNSPHLKKELERSHRRRCHSEPDLLLSAPIDTLQKENLNVAHSGRKEWTRRASALGKFSDDHQRDWGDLRQQVRQEKEARYNEYWNQSAKSHSEEQWPAKEPTKAKNRFMGAMNRIRETNQRQTQAKEVFTKLIEEMKQRQAEPSSESPVPQGDERKSTPEPGLHRAMTQADLMARRNENERSSNASDADAQGQVASWTMIKALARFKRGNKESDEDKVAADNASVAMLKKSRAKMLARAEKEGESGERKRVRGLDWMWDIPEEPVADAPIGQSLKEMGNAIRRSIVRRASETGEEAMSLQENLRQADSKWKMRKAANVVRFAKQLEGKNRTLLEESSTESSSVEGVLSVSGGMTMRRSNSGRGGNASVRTRRGRRSSDSKPFKGAALASKSEGQQSKDGQGLGEDLTDIAKKLVNRSPGASRATSPDFADKQQSDGKSGPTRRLRLGARRLPKTLDNLDKPVDAGTGDQALALDFSAALSGQSRRGSKTPQSGSESRRGSVQSRRGSLGSRRGSSTSISSRRHSSGRVLYVKDDVSLSSRRSSRGPDSIYVSSSAASTSLEVASASKLKDLEAQGKAKASASPRLRKGKVMQLSSESNDASLEFAMTGTILASPSSKAGTSLITETGQLEKPSNDEAQEEKEQEKNQRLDGLLITNSLASSKDKVPSNTGDSTDKKKTKSKWRRVVKAPEIDDQVPESPESMADVDVEFPRGVLDPAVLFGLPIDVIHTRLKESLMLFHRQRIAQQSSVKEEVELRPPKKVLAENSMLSPEAWKGLAHQMTRKSVSRKSRASVVERRASVVGEQLKEDLLGIEYRKALPDQADTQPTYGQVEAPHVNQTVTEPPVSKPRPQMQSPPAPCANRLVVPRLSEAIRDPNAQLDSALNVLNQYLEDFSGTELTEMLSSRPTTTNTRPGTGLPGLPPLQENRRVSSEVAAVAAMDSLDASKTPKLPAISALRGGTHEPTEKEKKQVQDLQRHISKRLQRLADITGRADASESEAKQQHDAKWQGLGGQGLPAMPLSARGGSESPSSWKKREASRPRWGNLTAR